MDFDITQGMVTTLLAYCKQGFCNGAGDNPLRGQFCVQQAVNMAVTSEEEDSDGPDCVHEKLCGLGIQLNDHEGWSSNQGRAKGLKRFAVAEMGTEEWNGEKIKEFRKLFRMQLGTDPELKTAELGTLAQDYLERNGSNTKTLTRVANIAAGIIKKLGSPGAKFLHLCDPKKKMSRQKRVGLAMKECRKHNQLYVTKPMAARMAQPASFTGCGMQFERRPSHAYKP
jgi:hypothetical protein